MVLLNQFENMNWLKIKKYLKKKNSKVIVPIGTMEVHGAHLPIASDVIVPLELAKYVATKINAIIAPPVFYGITRNMMHFVGSLSVSSNSFKIYITDLINSLIRTGFKTIILINGHGDQKEELEEVISNVEYKNVKMILINWYEECKDINKKIFKSSGGHAAVDETAAILSINPKIVKKKNFKLSHIGYFSELNKNKKWSLVMISNRKDKGLPIFNKKLADKYFSLVKRRILKIIKDQL